MTQPAKPARPLSPHLQVYRPQLTSVLSILHRMTGVGLALGLPVLVTWLVALAGGKESYAQFMSCADSTLGKILLFGWSWAFFYHFCTGVRHLFWDSGRCLELKAVYATGWMAVGVSTLVTAFVWLKILGMI